MLLLYVFKGCNVVTLKTKILTHVLKLEYGAHSGVSLKVRTCGTTEWRNVYINMNAHVHGKFQLLGLECSAALYKAQEQFRKATKRLYKAVESFHILVQSPVTVQKAVEHLHKAAELFRDLVQSPGTVQKAAERLYKAAEPFCCLAQLYNLAAVN